MCIKVSLVAPVPIVSCPFAMHCCVSLLHNPSLSSGKLKFGHPEHSLLQAGGSLLSFQPQRSQVTAWAVSWDRDLALRVCSWCCTPAEVALFTSEWLRE